MSNYQNYTQNSVVSGSYYSDSISNYAQGAVLYGGYGDDTIYSNITRGSYRDVTMSGGAGNDSLRSVDGYVSMSGGAGADTIVASASGYSTINGGSGSDLISLSSGGHNLIQFDSGDGYDTIYGAKNTDTINVGYNPYSTISSGSDMIIYVNGSAAMKVVNGASSSYYAPSIYSSYSYYTPVTVSGYVGRNVSNYNKSSVVSGTSYTDTIKNYAGGVTVNGGYGDDIIYSNVLGSYTVSGGYGYVTLSGGAGNDSIYSVDGHVSVSGGAGADTIRVGSVGYSTVNGGAGNDLISLSGGGHNLIQFASGDGYDTIYDISSTDTINVGYNSYSTISSGSNMIVYVNGSAAMNVVEGAYKGVKISGYDPASEPTVVEPTPVYPTVTSDTTPSSSSTLTLNSYQSSDIWMSRLQYTSYYNLDATSTYNHLILAGNSKANSIVAGSGGDSLWGGDDTVSDTLVGGYGADTFFYLKGNGNDVFTKVSSNDTVRLYNINLSEITSLGTTANSLTIGFNDGNTLRVQDQGVSAKFQLAGGSTWKYTHSTNTWGIG